MQRPTNWRIIILQRFSYRSGFWASHQAPQPGVWHWEHSPEDLALTASRAWVQGKQTPLLDDAHKNSCALEHGKAVIPREPAPDMPADVKGSFGEVRVDCGSLWEQRHWWQRPQGSYISVNSRVGHHFGTQTWPHPTACSLWCWDPSSQTTNRVGTWHHSSADRLPKVCPECTANSKHTP